VLPLFFKKLKSVVLSVKELNIVNDVMYKYAKIYYEILFIVGKKNKKSDNFVDLKCTYLDLDIFYFCVPKIQSI
jgi:hypothetical protein